MRPFGVCEVCPPPVRSVVLKQMRLLSPANALGGVLVVTFEPVASCARKLMPKRVLKGVLTMELGKPAAEPQAIRWESSCFHHGTDRQKIGGQMGTGGLQAWLLAAILVQVVASLGYTTFSVELV